MRPHLSLYEDSIPWILNHIDCFVSMSRGNESVNDLYLWPHAFHGHDEHGWDKVGQAVGNLPPLETLYIFTFNRTNGEHGPDWGGTGTDLHLELCATEGQSRT
jgi:hypothetical protein